MKLSDFDYDLPEHLIAQFPCKKRDESRLLVVNRLKEKIVHDSFKNIHLYLPEQSLIVINNSKVIPARLLGAKQRTGGQVEVFLLKQIDETRFEAMLKPLKKIREAEVLDFGANITCSLVDREKRIVQFNEPGIIKKLEKYGHIPLPPYIRREDVEADRVHYQTVYARHLGSVAAPTAGLHFTKPLMNALAKKGHEFAPVTLHVNYGTFKPVEAEDIAQHKMHFESYEVPKSTLVKMANARSSRRKIVAVGTTSCRTLESFARTGKVKDSTNLFMYPGGAFEVVDALITNFHLPRSTLLMLVAAFGGMALIKRAYQEAIKEQYRFYSYGDAMIIV